MPGPAPLRLAADGAGLQQRVSNAKVRARARMVSPPPGRPRRGEPEPVGLPGAALDGVRLPAAGQLQLRAAELAKLLGALAAAGPVAESVFLDDDRVQVTATQLFPWCGICHLVLTTADGFRGSGSGWLAGPRTVVTAGHCVYLHDHGGWVEHVEVYPGRNAGYRPYGCVSTDLHSVTGWTEARRPELDYGAILLPEPVPMQTLAHRVVTDAELRQCDLWVNVFGYPADQAAGTLWGSARVLAEARPLTLVYHISTYGGQSGCPVFVKEGKQRYAVGIHNYGDTSVNLATRITGAVSQNLEAWVGSAAE